ncbi:hypothetical protein [Escherichia phage FL12]
MLSFFLIILLTFLTKTGSLYRCEVFIEVF